MGAKDKEERNHRDEGDDHHQQEVVEWHLGWGILKVQKCTFEGDDFLKSWSKMESTPKKWNQQRIRNDIVATIK